MFKIGTHLFLNPTPARMLNLNADPNINERDLGQGVTLHGGPYLVIKRIECADITVLMGRDKNQYWAANREIKLRPLEV